MMFSPTDLFILVVSAAPFTLPDEKYPPSKKLLISFCISFSLYLLSGIFEQAQTNIIRNTEDVGGVPKGVIVEVVP